MPNQASRQRSRIARLPGLSAADEALQRDMLKLRAALVLLGTPRGARVAAARACVAEFKRTHLRACVRSVYRWRTRYLESGFSEIARKHRSDRGYPRQFGEDMLNTIAEAATRIRRHGDCAREYRRLKPPICAESFRVWVRRVQAFLNATRAAERGKAHGIL